MADDAAQIAVVRARVEQTCPCADYERRTHGRYVSCAAGVIKSAARSGELRSQCAATVKKYYAASTCGVPASKKVIACIKTTTDKTTGDDVITCAIQPSTKCVLGWSSEDSNHFSVQAPCMGFSICIDAADTDHNGLIGPGDDGTCAHELVDNGDGTITDNRTRLMWEKKDDAGGIHDKDNLYTWSTCADYPKCSPDGSAFTVFLAGLNTPPCFAGHCDWRLPAVGGPTGPAAELESIMAWPGSQWCEGWLCVPPAFDDACTPGCTATTCSCTGLSGGVFSSLYWSGSTIPWVPPVAWGVDFGQDRGLSSGDKSTSLYARAVRDLDAVATPAPTETCLTGTAPSVAADATRIAAVRALVEDSCQCAQYDGSAGRTLPVISPAQGTLSTALLRPEPCAVNARRR